MLAAFCAACCAANGVPFREPRKPNDPELFQLTVLPCVSAMVTMVLLNVAWMWTIPKGTFLRSFFLKVFPLRLPFFSAAPAAATGLAIFNIPFQTRNYVLPRLSLGRRLLLVRNRALARTLTGTCVGVRALSADRQAAAMAISAI